MPVSPLSSAGGDPSIAAFAKVDRWGEALPDMRGKDIPDVCAGVSGEILIAYRDPASVVVCDSDGQVQRVVGLGVVKRPHGVAADERHIYVVDEAAHCVWIFDHAGATVGSIGSGPSDPTFPVSGLHVDLITRPHPPFTRPTRLAVGPDGDLFISDGYGNCRVHRYSQEGRLVRSWGTPGITPGAFNIPHAVYVDRDERVLVCDRENDRIELFDLDGRLLEVWADLHRPQAVVQWRDGDFYVAEGSWDVGRISPTLGPVEPAPSRVSVLDPSGRRRGVIGPGADVEADFVSAHGIAIDRRGDLYVGECIASLNANAPGTAPADRPAIQKLLRG